MKDDRRPTNERNWLVAGTSTRYCTMRSDEAYPTS